MFARQIEMMERPDRPQRRSPRLQGYDYSQEGAYFVTICTQNRVCLFGDIVNSDMRLNAAGKMIESWWEELANKFSDVMLDLYVVMPNHVHGIVLILRDSAGGHAGPPLHDGVVNHSSLDRHMQWFKTMTTNHYMRGVKERNWESFPNRLWQRSYHDHIIRNELSLNTLREYVLYNPARWAEDQFNPISPNKPL